ncbi:small monomeric GTPase [Entamoeba marina]
MSDGFQIIIIGEGSVGKSALCLQFVREIFSTEYNPTIEDTYNKSIKVDGQTVSFNLIDTAGQEEYVALREQYFLKGDGFVLVYSIDNKTSFTAIANHKESISAIRPNDNVALMLAGNKCDLEDQRVIQKSEGEELAKLHGMGFFETSAANRTNSPITNLIKKNSGDKTNKPTEKKKKKGGCVMM